MDIFLILIGFIFVCLGLAGSFLPIIPGPLTGWVGLFILYLSESIPSNWTFLVITLTIALLVFLLDNVLIDEAVCKNIFVLIFLLNNNKVDLLLLKI